eukprot:5285611-Prymnesium_polylepis.1
MELFEDLFIEPHAHPTRHRSNAMGAAGMCAHAMCGPIERQCDHPSDTTGHAGRRGAPSRQAGTYPLVGG